MEAERGVQSRFLITAAVNSEVVAEPAEDAVDQSRRGRDSIKEHAPPISAVRIFPSLMTSKTAFAILSAMWSMLTTDKKWNESGVGMKSD